MGQPGVRAVSHDEQDDVPAVARGEMMKGRREWKRRRSDDNTTSEKELRGGQEE